MFRMQNGVCVFQYTLLSTVAERACVSETDILDAFDDAEYEDGETLRAYVGDWCIDRIAK